MTMQVAMVGTDGIVLAGDTKWSWSNEPIHWTQKSSKIKIDPEHRIAVSCARNMEVAQPIADAIIGLPEDAWKQPRAFIGLTAQPIVDKALSRKDAQCLIIRAGMLRHFYRLQVATINGVPDQVICHEIDDRAVAGNNNNAAIYWMERYHEKRPVGQLISLAAQLVVSSAKLNSAMIGGLEIVVCLESGIHRLSDESIDELETDAKRFDESIGKSLRRNKQFTYAPGVKPASIAGVTRNVC